ADEWVNQQTEQNVDDFAMWIRGVGPEPMDGAKMNCEESVYYSAYKAGVIPKSWIEKVYSQAAQDVFQYGQTIYGALGSDGAKPITSTAEPAPGDLVFLKLPNGNPAHVALSLGTNAAGEHEVMSLWTWPPIQEGNYNFNSLFQRTTVEDLLKWADAFNQD